MCFLSAMIQAKSVGNNKFHLVFNGDGQPDGYLYITSKGEGLEVTVSVSNFHLKTFISLEALIVRKTKGPNLFLHDNSSILQQTDAYDMEDMDSACMPGVRTFTFFNSYFALFVF